MNFAAAPSSPMSYRDKCDKCEQLRSRLFFFQKERKGSVERRDVLLYFLCYPAKFVGIVDYKS